MPNPKPKVLPALQDFVKSTYFFDSVDNTAAKSRNRCQSLGAWSLHQLSLGDFYLFPPQLLFIGVKSHPAVRSWGCLVGFGESWAWPDAQKQPLEHPCEGERSSGQPGCHCPPNPFHTGLNHFWAPAPNL